MYYEINVAKNGQHYFATDKRSITYCNDAVVLVKDFIKRFPANEGFTISVSYNPERSFGFDIPATCNNEELLAIMEILGR